MKQIALLLSFNLLVLCNTLGQRQKTINLSFLESEFIIQKDGTTMSLSSTHYPIQYDSDYNKPGLPYVIIHVLIGENEEFVSVKANSTEYLMQQNVLVESNPQYHTKKNIIKGQKKRNVRYPNDIYPMESIRYVGASVVDGYKYLTFHVSPFRYYALKKDLYFQPRISLTIHLSSAKAPIANGRKGHMKDLIRHLVINGEEMPALYNEEKYSAKQKFLPSTETIDYLIITCDSLANSFKRLADWKTKKGVPAKIITTEFIDTAYTTYNFFNQANPALSIKRAIKDYYDQYGIKYVLLGGDVNIVPTERCYLECNGERPSWNRKAACDLYYACLNGPIDWDYYHQNSSSAEYEDLIDMHPQLAVSRLSVVSNADAIAQINRIINYELGPRKEEWSNRFLLAGCGLTQLL